MPSVLQLGVEVVLEAAAERADERVRPAVDRPAPAEEVEGVHAWIDAPL